MIKRLRGKCAFEFRCLRRLADSFRKRDRLKERRDREAEKIRLEQLAAKMSAKKLQRMKKVSTAFMVLERN